MAREHPAERLRAVAQIGAAAVVLKTGDHPRAAAQVGLDRAVADQPRSWLAHGPQIHELDAGQLLVAQLVARAEQLVPAADREHDGSAVGRGVERVALRGHHVARHEHLVAVLAAAHVEEVVRVRVERLAQARGGKREADAAPLAAGAEHRDVPAVGIDVHEIGIEPADAERVAHPAASRTTTVLPTYPSVSGTRRRARTSSPHAVASASSSSGSTRSRRIVATSPAWSPPGET